MKAIKSSKIDKDLLAEFEKSKYNEIVKASIWLNKETDQAIIAVKIMDKTLKN